MEDLKITEAKAITVRIRKWVKAIPVDDVQRAYEGRVWLVMGYGSWAQWCEAELNGFKLPAPQRKQVVEELVGHGMSNRSIAEVVGAGETTVRRDRAGAPFGAPGGKSLGQDGKAYGVFKSKTKPVEPEPNDDNDPLDVDEIECEEPESDEIDYMVNNRYETTVRRDPVLAAQAHLSAATASLNDAAESLIGYELMPDDRQDIERRFERHAAKVDMFRATMSSGNIDDALKALLSEGVE